MKYLMTVHRTEEVEIPDLPQDVMEYVADHKAKISVNINVETYEEGGDFVELWVEIEVPEETSEEEDEDFWEGLDEFSSCDPETLKGGTPYFQSDSDDALQPCKNWLIEMKKRFPNVKIDE